MSLKHEFWKWRTSFRPNDQDDCFAINNLGVANPGELRFVIDDSTREKMLALIGKQSVLGGDWDLKKESFSADTTEESPADVGAPVTLVIGRDGDSIILEGVGQVLTALQGGKGEIACRIAFVHPEWQKFRNQIMNFSDSHKGSVYQKIHHPDLIRVPWGHGDERLDLIAPHMPMTSGTVLDIGANWGYWSHAMSRLGLQPLAVDHNPKNGYFLRKLRRAMAGTFEFKPDSVFDLPGKLHYDIILGLNIFHHFIRKKEMLDRFVDLLGRFDAKYLFFEPHRKSELEEEECYHNMDEDEFIEFIFSHSCFTSSKHIGTARNGRQVFLLARE
jgi:hypothetical protein